MHLSWLFLRVLYTEGGGEEEKKPIRATRGTRYPCELGKKKERKEKKIKEKRREIAWKNAIIFIDSVAC